MKSFIKKTKPEEEDLPKDDLIRFKSFIDYSSSPFFQSTLDGELLYVNQAFAKVLSYFSKSDLLEFNLKEDLFSDIKLWKNFLEHLKKKKRVENVEIQLLSKLKKVISINVDVRLVVNKGGKVSYFEGIVAKRQIVNPIQTSNKELEHELEELRKKEKSATSQANKANYTKNVKSQYLATMTHEIKTPINSIVGFLTLIEQKLFDSEEELQDFAHNARISADSLLEIINNILDISQIEAGKVDLDEVKFNLSLEVEKAKAVALPAGGNSKVKISTTISNKITSDLVGDPVRYRQVLINILTNSVKYTEEGNIDIVVEVDKVEDSSVSLKTTIKDTGIGIPKEQLSLLFKPYTQVKTKKWNKKDGSGLGLMICKEIVKLMDGEIIIKSKQGKGTIVQFTTLFKTTNGLLSDDQLLEKDNSQEEVNNKLLIPQNGDDEIADEEIVNSSDFIEETRSDIKRILLVEDNPISQQVELKLLKQSGYIVEAVSNGYDAIEAVKTKRFHLVLMDVEMSEMDGLESTKQIRALEPPISNIPIIAVTAHSSMKDREKCLTSGMNDYIAKPININFMRMIIDHWLLREVKI